jgi:hypothetical protein
MPDAKPPEKLEEQLANEIATLRDLAAKSSDPLIVAKAVAAFDTGVQQLILARLSAGEHLVEVFVLQGTARLEAQVFFRFIPAKEVAHFVDTGVLAFVDLANGEVIGTVDPFILQPERRVGRPFVSIAALNTSAFAASNQAMKPLVERERAFLGSLGLGQLGGGNPSANLINLGGGGGGDTVCASPQSSATYSGQPYRQDDSRADDTYDYCDSPAPDPPWWWYA